MAGSKKYVAPTHDEVRRQWDGLFEAINHEEDLICVVVATSYVDSTLAALLKAYFIDSTMVDVVLSHNGALGSLMAKANVAYCLGLLSKDDRFSIEKIAYIRNEFAHRIDASFADHEIEQWCDELKAIVFKGEGSHIGHSLRPLNEGGEKSPARSRTRFMITATLLCTSLAVSAMSMQRCDEAKEQRVLMATVIGEPTPPIPPA